MQERRTLLFEAIFFTAMRFQSGWSKVSTISDSDISCEVPSRISHAKEWSISSCLTCSGPLLPEEKLKLTMWEYYLACLKMGYPKNESLLSCVPWILHIFDDILIFNRMSHFQSQTSRPLNPLTWCFSHLDNVIPESDKRSILVKYGIMGSAVDVLKIISMMIGDLHRILVTLNTWSICDS